MMPFIFTEKTEQYNHVIAMMISESWLKGVWVTVIYPVYIKTIWYMLLCFTVSGWWLTVIAAVFKCDKSNIYVGPCSIELHTKTDSYLPNVDVWSLS